MRHSQRATTERRTITLPSHLIFIRSRSCWPSPNNHCQALLSPQKLDVPKSLISPAGWWLTTLFSPAQWDLETGAAQSTMATHCPSDWSRTCGYEHTENTLPLRQWNRDVSFGSKGREPASSESSPEPAVTKRRRQGNHGPSSRLLMYREQLISLFWGQDLPLREVQEIMKKEHGLDVR